MISTEAGNLTALSHSGYSLTFYVDILTADIASLGATTPERYRFWSEYPPSYNTPFTFPTDDPYEIDYVWSGGTLTSMPSYTRTTGGGGTSQISICVPNASITGTTPMMTAWKYEDFIGADIAWGIVIPSSSATAKHIVIDKGRCVGVQWDDEYMTFELINPAERLKGQIPKWDINLEQWVKVEDTLNNPDPTNPWEQLNALHDDGAAQGRYRCGQKYAGITPETWGFMHPAVRDIWNNQDYLSDEVNEQLPTAHWWD